jgi:hypothetical protein
MVYERLPRETHRFSMNYPPSEMDIVLEFLSYTTHTSILRTSRTINEEARGVVAKTVENWVVGSGVKTIMGGIGNIDNFILLYNIFHWVARERDCVSSYSKIERQAFESMAIRGCELEDLANETSKNDLRNWTKSSAKILDMRTIGSSKPTIEVAIQCRSTYALEDKFEFHFKRTKHFFMGALAYRYPHALYSVVGCFDPEKDMVPHTSRQLENSVFKGVTDDKELKEMVPVMTRSEWENWLPGPGHKHKQLESESAYEATHTPSGASPALE